MLDNLYANIGGKIKTWAKWMFIIEAIGAIITGLIMLFADEELILYGLLILVFGPIVAWVSTWILYAFGELVEDIHAMRSNYRSQAEEKAFQKTAPIQSTKPFHAQPMTGTHMWRCPHCGKGRMQVPCEYCGKE